MPFFVWAVLLGAVAVGAFVALGQANRTNSGRQDVWRFVAVVSVIAAASFIVLGVFTMPDGGTLVEGDSEDLPFDNR